ncbi:MAG: hypothetical protein NVV82_24595 [Sporocytophaga sp.]|nr:hypothetical protein [Sporocytophaga sp.]
MKKIFRLFSLAALSAVLLTSCGDDTEPTPDTNPDAKVFELALNDNSKETKIEGVVSTSDGTAKIRLNVVSTTDLDQIFILKSQDNGDLTPYIVSTITTADGKTFNGGTNGNYSLKVPGSTKSFVIDIPVNIRSSSSAVTDVYSIWITNGTGAFTIPTKKKVLGIGTVVLKYDANASSSTFTSFSTTLGDQQATPPSLLVTSGQGGTLTTADFKDASFPENAASADISFSGLNAGGTALGNVSYFISPSERTAVGFNGEPTGVNTTTFAEYTATTFENATASNLSALTTSSTKIAVEAGKTYAFTTAKGKKGIVKVNSITTSGNGKAAAVSVKVLN